MQIVQLMDLDGIPLSEPVEVPDNIASLLLQGKLENIKDYYGYWQEYVNSTPLVKITLEDIIVAKNKYDAKNKERMVKEKEKRKHLYLKLKAEFEE